MGADGERDDDTARPAADAVPAAPIDGVPEPSVAASPGPPVGRLLTWLHVVVLVAACFVVYDNGYDHAYQLDSLHTVLENPAVRSLSYLPSYFTDATTASTLNSNVDYRPVLMVGYALNHWWGGYDMASWHAVQIGLHAVCVVGLYLLARGLLRRGTGRLDRGAAHLAFLAGLVFAVQPTASGVVMYLSARSSLQAAAFMFVAILLYLGSGPGHRRRAWAWWSTLPYALALFTKVEAVACLAVFFMVEAWDRRHRTGSPSSLVGDVLGSLRGSVLVRLAPHLAVTAAYFVIRGRLMADLPFAESSKPNNLTNLDYLLTQTTAWWYYVANWFAPFGLVADHGSFEVQRELTAAPVLLALGGWGLVATVVIAQWKRRPWLVVPAVSGLALISPTSSIVPLAEMVNEHRPYMPIAVLSLCWMLALPSLLGSVSSRALRALCVAALVVVIVAFGRATYARNEVFHTEESYWKDIIDKAPSWRAHTNYGRTLMAKGQNEEAVEHFQATLKDAPYWYIVHVNLGVVYDKLGQAELALQHYDKAVEYVRYTATALSWRAEALLARKQYARALADLQTSEPRNRDHFRLNKGLATAHAGLGDGDQAWIHTERCLDIDPQATTLNIVRMAGPFFEAPERYEPGIAYFERLATRLPDAWWVYENIATLATRLGRDDLAADMRARSAALKGGQGS